MVTNQNGQQLLDSVATGSKIKWFQLGQPLDTTSFAKLQESSEFQELDALSFEDLLRRLGDEYQRLQDKYTALAGEHAFLMQDIRSVRGSPREKLMSLGSPRDQIDDGHKPIGPLNFPPPMPPHIFADPAPAPDVAASVSIIEHAESETSATSDDSMDMKRYDSFGQNHSFVVEKDFARSDGVVENGFTSSEVVVENGFTNGEAESPASGSRSNAKLWATWTDATERETHHGGAFSSIKTQSNGEYSRGRFNLKSVRREALSRGGDEIYSDTWLQTFVLKPGSHRKLCWDIVSFLCLLWDMIMLPLQMFDLPQNMFMLTTDYATAAFWTLDIVLSFMTGFYDKGLLEMRPSKITKRYLRQWFIPDIVIVLGDWMALMMSDHSVDYFALLRLSRGLRFARVLKMVRLLRMMKVLHNFLIWLDDGVYSEAVTTALYITKLVALLILVNHFFACMWYGIGTLDVNGRNWVQELKNNEQRQPSKEYFYATSLHWSLTQFTPASMEVVPRNVVERAYCICVIVFALVCFSSFISSITSAMNHLRQMDIEQAKQQETVRHYITQNRIPLELGNRLVAFLRSHGLKKNTRVHENDMFCFSELPSSMLTELRVHVYLPILFPHPLFFTIHDIDEELYVNLCSNCMTAQTHLSCHEIFRPSEAASAMYFVIDGILEYIPVYCTDTSLIRQGCRICEMALWLQWKHRGALMTKTMCEVIMMDSQCFRSIVVPCNSFSAVKRYAQKYHANILKMGLGDMTDLGFDFDTTQEMAQTVFDDDQEMAHSHGHRSSTVKRFVMFSKGNSPSKTKKLFPSGSKLGLL